MLYGYTYDVYTLVSIGRVNLFEANTNKWNWELLRIESMLRKVSIYFHLISFGANWRHVIAVNRSMWDAIYLRLHFIFLLPGRRWCFHCENVFILSWRRLICFSRKMSEEVVDENLQLFTSTGNRCRTFDPKSLWRVKSMDSIAVCCTRRDLNNLNNVNIKFRR